MCSRSEASDGHGLPMVNAPVSAELCSFPLHEGRYTTDQYNCYTIQFNSYTDQHIISVIQTNITIVQTQNKKRHPFYIHKVIDVFH